MRSQLLLRRQAARFPAAFAWPDQVAEWAAARLAAHPQAHDRVAGGRLLHLTERRTSARVAQQLQEMKMDACALQGGYNAWAAAYPVEEKVA